MGHEDAHLLLHVPGDASHNIWKHGKLSVRVVQQMADTNVEVQRLPGRPGPRQERCVW